MDSTEENNYLGCDGILLDHVTMTGFQAVAQGNMAFVNLNEKDRMRLIRHQMSSLESIKLILLQLKSIYEGV